MNTLKFKKNNKKGFTLMEMLIVVAIIGILIAIAIPTFTKSLNEAKKATDEANLRAYYAEVMADHLLDGTSLPADGTTGTSVEIEGVTYKLNGSYTVKAATGGGIVFQYTFDGDKSVTATIPGTIK